MSSILSPSMNGLSPRWLVPVARMSPGSSVWIEVTHSMQRGILCAMSSELNFCITVPLLVSTIGSLCEVLDLVGGDDIGPDRREGVARLHLVEHVGRRHHAARRAVDEVGVAEHVFHRVLGFDMRSLLADDDGELRLAFEHRCRHVRQHHGVAVADDRARRLHESVDRCGLRQGAVLHVVHRHADDVFGLRQRRAELDLRQRLALALLGGRRELALQRPILDHAADDVLRPERLDALGTAETSTILSPTTTPSL